MVTRIRLAPLFFAAVLAAGGTSHAFGICFGNEFICGTTTKAVYVCVSADPYYIAADDADEVCSLTLEEDDRYCCLDFPGSYPGAGLPGPGTGGPGGPGQPMNPNDTNNDGRMDCWHNILSGSHPPPTMNQQLGSNYMGPNGIRPWHTGLDIDCNYGETVTSPVEGTVIGAGFELNSGWTVKVRNAGLTGAVYHMSSVAVTPGDYVHVGDVVGGCNNSGSETGPLGNHLHYEVAPTNTANYLDPQTMHPDCP